jgi:anti-anti-sigma factor
MMNIERIEMGLAVMLRLEGPIGEETANALRLALFTCIKDRRFNVVVNLSKVTDVSFLGLGILVERLRMLRKSGGDLKLVGVNQATHQMLRMSGIKTLFHVFETESQAVQAFREAA